MTWLRLDEREVFVVFSERPGPEGADQSADAAHRMTRFVRKLSLGLTVGSVALVDQGTRKVSLLFGTRMPLGLAPTKAVWGTPIGEAGEASDTELDAVLRDPRHARNLLGRWAVVGLVDHEARIVTSADLVSPLFRVHSFTTDTFATRGLLCLAIAGLPPRLRSEVVPERILFDYVFGRDTLLEGVETLDPATVIDFPSDGHSATHSYWPESERFASAEVSTASSLEAQLRRHVTQIHRLPNVQLALTAGRDSGLVASILKSAGLDVGAFTIGLPPSPDVVGAMAIAHQFGWPYFSMSVEDPRWCWNRVLEKTLWTDGLDTAWNMAGVPLNWSGPRDFVTISGSGGEAGRAFYWNEGPTPTTLDGAISRVADHLAEGCGQSAQQTLRNRVQAQVKAGLRTPGGSIAGSLDLLYVRGRMAKWLGHTVPSTGIRGTVACYTAPDLVSQLLSLPEAERKTGAAFDAALSGLTSDARAIAQRAIAEWPPPSEPARWRPKRKTNPFGALDDLKRQAGRLRFVEEVMGKGWFESRWAERKSMDAARRKLGGAFAVEALARVCAEPATW